MKASKFCDLRREMHSYLEKQDYQKLLSIIQTLGTLVSWFSAFRIETIESKGLRVDRNEDCRIIWNSNLAPLGNLNSVSPQMCFKQSNF